jgi:hypothetical protein
VRVDFTRMRAIGNKTMSVDLTRMRAESTRIRMVRKKQQQQKQKAKAGACRSKDYVYYDEFELIF